MRRRERLPVLAAAACCAMWGGVSVAQPSEAVAEPSSEQTSTEPSVATPPPSEPEPSSSPAPVSGASSVELPSPEQACLASHEKAQVLRLDGDLKAAEEQLVICAQEVCAEFIRSDCSTWRGEVMAAYPTVVVRALGDYGDIEEGLVTVDGAASHLALDGRRRRVNPGTRVIRVELPDGTSKEKRVVLSQGEKSRLITLDFRTPPPPQIAPVEVVPQVAVRPVPVATYVLAGAAVASAAVSIGFGVDAVKQKNQADDVCSPLCDEAIANRIKRSAAIADVAVGLSIASATAAVLVYVFRPTHHVDAEASFEEGGLWSPSPATRVTFDAWQSGGAIAWEGAF